MVTCIATNQCGTNRCSFDVSVSQTPALAIICPGPITTNICGTNVIVNYLNPVVTNGVLIGCVPPSGSSFPSGPTVVTCTAANVCGTNTCNFTVTVRDLPAVQIVCPQFLKTNTCTTNVIVTYANPVATNGTLVGCTPPSGSAFPLGPTVVTCIATNQCGTNRCSFDVSVTKTNCDCLVVLSDHADCSGTIPGKLTYTLSVLNNTGVPVSYITLVPLDSCFNFMPDIFHCQPPLLPGQATNITVMSVGASACGSNLCIIIAAHSSNFVQCCSILHCIPNPCVNPCASDAQLSIRWIQDSAVISWAAPGYRLQATTELANPNKATVWTDVAGASPVTVPASGPKKFFRIICQ